jgi:uncharacterized protein (DUF2141 family)
MLSAALLFSSALAGEVRLEISKTEHNSGQLLVVLFTSEDGWPSNPDKAYRRLIATPTTGTSVVVIPDVPPGRYAAFVVHDEDSDMQCDLGSVIPMPKEPIAASRDARAMFGPPKFQDAVFDVGDAPVVQRFRFIRY